MLPEPMAGRCAAADDRWCDHRGREASTGASLSWGAEGGWAPGKVWRCFCAESVHCMHMPVLA
jgi:hypothetical protein